MEADAEAQIEAMLLWWEKVSHGDAQATVPKAIEYSATDLIQIGETMLGFAPHLWGEADPVERKKVALLVGAGFYLQGKVGRLMSALQSGRIPSADTLHDITVYSMMLRHIYEKGYWVG
jgi:hypothetical protein